MKLYMVESYYHILITLCKAMRENEQLDLYVDTRMLSNFEELKLRLLETGLFRNIFTYDATQARNSIAKQNIVCRILSFRLMRSLAFHKDSPLTLHDIAQYSDVYIFCTTGPMEGYVIAKKIPFHLLEDGLDYYVYFGKHYRFKEGDYLPGHFRFWVRKITGRTQTNAYLQAIDVEVNDKSKVVIPTKNVFELPRKELLSALTEEQKAAVYNIFTTGKHIESSSLKTALVCTRPLFDDRYVSSEQEQMDVIEHIVRDCVSQGYYILLKAHPRDQMDYSELVKKYQINIIDKSLPSEILNFNSKLEYAVVIGTGTTSVYAVEHAKRTVFLDRNAVMMILQDKNFHII